MTERVCEKCGMGLKTVGELINENSWDDYSEWFEEWDSTNNRWMQLCEECYEKEQKKRTNLELIKLISDKTDKLCWTELDIWIEILEERFKDEP